MIGLWADNRTEGAVMQNKFAPLFLDTAKTIDIQLSQSTFDGAGVANFIPLIFQ